MAYDIQGGFVSDKQMQMYWEEFKLGIKQKVNTKDPK